MKLSQMPKDDVKAGIKLKTEDGKAGSIGCVVFGNELKDSDFGGFHIRFEAEDGGIELLAFPHECEHLFVVPNEFRGLAPSRVECRACNRQITDRASIETAIRHYGQGRCKDCLSELHVVVGAADVNLLPEKYLSRAMDSFCD